MPSRGRDAQSWWLDRSYFSSTQLLCGTGFRLFPLRIISGQAGRRESYGRRYTDWLENFWRRVFIAMSIRPSVMSSPVPEPFKVEYSFSKPSDRAKIRRFTCDLFSAEYMQFAVTAPYDFAWHGPQFYLAIHNIRRLDGETCLDGSLRSHATDLRNKLTFAPPDCSISGWTHNVLPINSRIALLFNQKLLADELTVRFHQENFSPMLYFEDESLRSSLAKIQRLLCSETTSDRLYAETLGLLVAMELCQISGNAPAVETSHGLSERQSRLVLDFIKSNTHQQISLTDLANLAGQSRFHFCRAFKKSFGVSPVRHVRALRIEAARNLLRLHEMTIADVAAAVGFRGATQFSRVFSATTGMTPSEYRRSL
jgi:AraC family transcriptional regulator